MRGKASDLASNWLVAQNLDFSRDYLRALEHVDSETIRRVISTYLVDRNMTVVSLNPADSGGANVPAATGARAGELQALPAQQRNGAGGAGGSAPATRLGGRGVQGRACSQETPEDNGITKLLSKVMLKGTPTAHGGTDR
jgi:predicted Zn-dependent peptidase